MENTVAIIRRFPDLWWIKCMSDEVQIFFLWKVWDGKYSLPWTPLCCYFRWLLDSTLRVANGLVTLIHAFSNHGVNNSPNLFFLERMVVMIEVRCVGAPCKGAFKDVHTQNLINKNNKQAANRRHRHHTKNGHVCVCYFVFLLCKERKMKT